MRREKDYLTFHMHCLQSQDTGKWTIEVKHRNVLVSNRIEKVREGNSAFANIGKRCNTSRWPKFIEWAVLEKDYLVDDKLTAEIHVKIEKTTGIYKDNLRNFDATMKEFSDVVLVVNEQKFYALKLVSLNNFRNMFQLFQYFSTSPLILHISKHYFWEISTIRRNLKSN